MSKTAASGYKDLSFCYLRHRCPSKAMSLPSEACPATPPEKSLIGSPPEGSGSWLPLRLAPCDGSTPKFQSAMVNLVEWSLPILKLSEATSQARRVKCTVKRQDGQFPTRISGFCRSRNSRILALFPTETCAETDSPACHVCKKTLLPAEILFSAKAPACPKKSSAHLSTTSSDEPCSFHSMSVLKLPSFSSLIMKLEDASAEVFTIGFYRRTFLPRLTNTVLRIVSAC